MLKEENIPAEATTSDRPPVPDRCDVAVIGGGPAGSTTATLLAERGHRVVLCERDRFPRFHIGESLLPCGNRVLERLGVLEQCARSGWTEKAGATFLWQAATGVLPEGGLEGPGRGAYSSIRFAEALGGAKPSTFQVPRAEFDALLLDRAADAGALVLQECTVKDAAFDPLGAELTIRPKVGGESTLRAGFVVDASGQSGFLSRRLGLRRPDQRLRNLATFTQFEGWRWPERVEAGNIQVVSLRDLSWMWIIPLAADRVSVGLVEPASRRIPGGDRAGRLEAAIRATEVVAAQAREARRLGPVRSMADFGYGVERYSGDRWILVGDAGSFVDPVFSTGVYLALASGEEAADLLHRSLERPRGKIARRMMMRRFQRTQHRRYRFFRRFVLRYYRSGLRDVLCQRRNGLGVPQALGSVLAGEWRLPWRLRWRLELFYLLASIQERFDLVAPIHTREVDGGADGQGLGGSRSAIRGRPRLRT